MPSLQISNSTMMISFSFLIILITSSLSLTSSLPCDNADMLTLLNIKQSLGNPSDLDSWDPANAAECCSWTRVSCNNESKIDILSIPDATISGTPLPSAIGNLSELTDINFANLQNITGSIPDSFSKLTKLTSLSISASSISGKIPSVITKLRSLEFLDLSKNKFTGQIPSFLCDLPNLHYIVLARSNFAGKVPPCLFSRLRGSKSIMLSLAQNKLVGDIPKSFANINFAFIDLSHNKLTGDASVLFGPNKSSLFAAYLSSNKLSFDLSWLKFPLKLSQLDLSHNKIRGRIPQQINKVAANFGPSFNVSYNKLCGPIPKKLGSSVQPSAFQHNKCLCGAPLAPCRRLL